jgi:hypothetical protein
MQDLKFHQKHFHGNCTTNCGFYFGESYEKDVMAKIQRKRHGYKNTNKKTEIQIQKYKDTNTKTKIQRQRQQK